MNGPVSLSSRVNETNQVVNELSQRVQDLEKKSSRSSTPDKQADSFSTPISLSAPQPQKPTSQPTKYRNADKS